MTSYRDSGVDQQAADDLVPLFGAHAARTRRPEVVDDVGGFAGLFSLEGIAQRGFARPALVASTDGVGTKVELLRAAGAHATAGWDAVAMNVDDVVCVGAEPLLVVDYVSIERLDRGVMDAIVGGVADACLEAGCSLVGGETSQHPGLLPPGGYDVVATCVGIVDRDRTWGAHRVRPGDAIVGLPSSGPHANGFALVRRLLQGGDTAVPPELLAPTAIYCRRLLAVAAAGVAIHAVAHVTGGGIAGNLARVLPAGCGAELGMSWPCPPVFGWIASRGVGPEEMGRVFNLGVGMLVIVPDPEAAVAAFAATGLEAFLAGQVTAGPGITPVVYRS